MSNSIARRFRQALDDSNLTYQELADIVGVTPQAVYKWTRTGKIARKHIEPVCKAINVSIEWLLADSNELTKDERDILSMYRSMTEDKRKLFRDVAIAFAEQAVDKNV